MKWCYKIKKQKKKGKRCQYQWNHNKLRKRTNLSRNILQQIHFYIHIQTSNLRGLSHSYRRYGMERKNMETTKRRRTKLLQTTLID